MTSQTWKRPIIENIKIFSFSQSPKLNCRRERDFPEREGGREGERGGGEREGGERERERAQIFPPRFFLAYNYVPTEEVDLNGVHERSI